MIEKVTLSNNEQSDQPCSMVVRLPYNALGEMFVFNKFVYQLKSHA